MKGFRGDFWQKVAQTEDTRACWRWKARKNRAGYGFYRFREAHRVAFELFYGAVDATTPIFHACGDKLCCNPEHLLLGTAPVTAPEMRGRRFDPLPLTWNEVLIIRALRKEKSVTVRELAAQFGVSMVTISRIANNKTWTSAA